MTTEADKARAFRLLRYIDFEVEPDSADVDAVAECIAIVRAEATQAERERCAKVAESCEKKSHGVRHELTTHDMSYNDAVEDITEAIRALPTEGEP